MEITLWSRRTVELIVQCESRQANATQYSAIMSHRYFMCQHIAQWDKWRNEWQNVVFMYICARQLPMLYKPTTQNHKFYIVHNVLRSIKTLGGNHIKYSRVVNEQHRTANKLFNLCASLPPRKQELCFLSIYTHKILCFLWTVPISMFVLKGGWPFWRWVFSSSGRCHRTNTLLNDKAINPTRVDICDRANFMI